MFFSVRGFPKCFDFFAGNNNFEKGSAGRTRKPDQVLEYSYSSVTRKKGAHQIIEAGVGEKVQRTKEFTGGAHEYVTMEAKIRVGCCLPTSSTGASVWEYYGI